MPDATVPLEPSFKTYAAVMPGKPNSARTRSSSPWNRPAWSSDGIVPQPATAATQTIQSITFISGAPV